MSFFDRPFERKLHRAALREIKRSPDLSRERSRVARCSVRLDRGIPYPFACCVAFLLTGSLGFLGRGPFHAVAQLTVVLLSLGCAVERARALRLLLLETPELSFLLGHPADDALLRRRAWSLFLRESVWFLPALVAGHLACDLPAGQGAGFMLFGAGMAGLIWLPVLAWAPALAGLIGVLLLYVGAGRLPEIDPMVAVAGLAGGVLDWALMLALATGIVAHRPEWARGRIAAAVILAAGALVYVRVYAAGFAVATLSTVGVLLPAGWGILATEVAVRHGQVWGMLVLIPAVVLLGFWPVFARRAGMRLQQAEATLVSVPSPEGVIEALVEEVGTAAPETAGARGGQDWLRVEARTRLHDFFASRVTEAPWMPRIDWAQLGWLERWIAGHLTPEERRTAEWLLVEPPRWSRKLEQGVWFALASALAICAASWVRGRPAEILSIVGTICGISGVIVPPFVDDSIPGLLWVPDGTASSPAYLRYPADFREIVSVRTKVIRMRLIAYAPVILGLFGFLVWFKGGPWVDVLWGVAAFIVEILVALPLLLCLGMLSGVPKAPRRGLGLGCGVALGMLGAAGLMISWMALGGYVPIALVARGAASGLSEFLCLLAFVAITTLGAAGLLRLYASRYFDFVKRS